MRRTRWRTLRRDTVLFIAGLVLALNEGLVRDSERPSLLVLAGAMMGLPAFLQADARRKERRDTGEIPITPGGQES